MEEMIWENKMMRGLIYTFDELGEEVRSKAGGKGGTLSRLFQSGYPVPEGFVILPSAFEGDQLTPNAWHEIEDQLSVIRKKNGKTAFAVRSSAIAEDSAYASFAGEFETVLDVHSNEAIRAAIMQVHVSRKSERVQAYSKAKGIDGLHGGFSGAQRFSAPTPGPSSRDTILRLPEKT
jgi:pyruvate,water dikinase